MDNLRYLEITRAFNNYYKTLRDMNVYLQNDPDVDEEELRTASLVISRLIFEFIRVDGTTFLDMNSEEFEMDYQIFKGDFLNIIQSSGEQNVDFEELTELVDDLLEIADRRAETLGKINRGFVEDLFEDEDDEIDFMDVGDFQDENEVENETEVVSSSDDTDDDEFSVDEDENSDENLVNDEESEDENENEDVSSAHLVQFEDEDDEGDNELGNDDLVEVKVKVEVEEEIENENENEDKRNDDYEEFESQNYRIYRRKRYD